MKVSVDDVPFKGVQPYRCAAEQQQVDAKGAQEEVLDDGGAVFTDGEIYPE